MIATGGSHPFPCRLELAPRFQGVFFGRSELLLIRATFAIGPRFVLKSREPGYHSQ